MFRLDYECTALGQLRVWEAYREGNEGPIRAVPMLSNRQFSSPEFWIVAREMAIKI